MVRELGKFKLVLQFLSSDTMCLGFSVEETLNQKLSKNYEILGVLHKFFANCMQTQIST